jgi:hypothetical protein
MRVLRRSGPAFSLALFAAALGGAAPSPAPTAPQKPKPSSEAAPAAAGGLQVKIGRGPSFSRLEFHGGGASVVRQGEHDVVLRFSRPGNADLSRLRVDPPPYLKQAASKRTGAGLELTLTLADEAVASIGRSDGALYVNLSEPDEKAAPAAAKRADPAPASGVVKVQSMIDGPTVRLGFTWAAPAPAAVFRRGEAVWVVFDSRARLDVTGAPRNLPSVKAVAAFQGEGWTALRVLSPSDTAVSAVAEGAKWTVAFGPGAGNGAAAPIAVTRDPAGDAVLQAALAGATAVHAITDPVVGDRIAAVTALAPAKGHAARREFVELVLLPSVQGLAIEAIADDLAVAVEGEHVRLGRPKGLRLSAVAPKAAPRKRGPVELPKAASMPGLVDFPTWSRTGEGGFITRYEGLLDAAAAEQQTPGAARDGRMGLVRFLLGSELPHEAVGVLNMMQRRDQGLLSDAEFRALRGAAKVMMGRLREAEADFASPVLSADPASALWRGYVAQQLGDPVKAREAFTVGAPALSLFAPNWRVRFERALGEAALAQGDLPAARRALAAAAGEPVDGVQKAMTQLAQARLLEAENAAPKALVVYETLALHPYGGLSTPALLRATLIKRQTGALSDQQASDLLNSLRWRWRGGPSELETVGALGRLELARGRYREGLAALRLLGPALPDTPAGRALHLELMSAFRGLFLEGDADGLEPIQALGLFYDFRDLTPVGADGDLMVRRLSRRLIDVDLLPQAAELLEHQAKRRLDGVASAQVATDLALVQLMDRRPQDALKALRDSRTTVLPPALNAERRVLEARALAAIGRLEHALEVIQNDASVDAQDVRAEIAWKAARWPEAGPAFERALGDRWRSRAPLTALEESRLLRAGAAYSLAGDAAALKRLQGRYGPLIDTARAPDALRVALAGGEGLDIASPGFARAASDGDAFAAWVQAMKKRFRDQPPTLAAPPLKTAAKAGGAAAG